MDPLADRLKQQRQLNPPPGAVNELEQAVMARLDRLPGERRRKRMSVAGVTLGCALVLLLTLVLIRPRVHVSKPPDFLESVVILDDHVCIWLETAGTISPNGRSHP